MVTWAAALLYWASIFLIGYGIAVGRSEALTGLNGPAKCLVYFGTGFGVFVVPTVLFTAARYPVWLLALTYAAALAFAIYRIVKNPPKLSRLNPKQIPFGIYFLAAILILDFLYGITALPAAMIDGDVAVQVARLNQFTNGHLSILSPFFAGNGVYEPRYSLNILSALSSLPTTYLKIQPFEFWSISSLIFRPVIWLSIMAVLWQYLRGIIPKDWLYLAFAGLLLLFGRYFSLGFMPDRFINIWLALLLLGLYIWAKKGKSALLVLAVSLIAVTHAMYALFGLLLLGLIIIVLAAAKLLRRKDILPLAVSVAALGLPVILNIAMPNRVAEDKIALTAATLFGREPYKQLWHGVYLPRLEHIDLAGLMLVVTAVILSYAARKYLKRHRTSLNISLLLLAVAMAAIGSPVLISLLLYPYFLLRTENQRLRLILYCLFIFNALLIYNPVVLTIGSGMVPDWLLARSAQLNFFAYIAAFLGLMLLVHFMTKGVKANRYAPYLCLPILLFYSSWPAYAHPQLGLSDLFKQKRPKNVHEFIPKADLKAVKNQMEGQTVFSYTRDTGMFLAMYAKINIVNASNYNTSPMVNNVRRDACQERLTKFMAPTDLAAAKVTRVLVDTRFDDNIDEVIDGLSTKPYIKFLQITNNFVIYGVTSGAKYEARAKNSLCSIPYGQ